MKEQELKVYQLDDLYADDHTANALCGSSMAVFFFLRHRVAGVNLDAIHCAKCLFSPTPNPSFVQSACPAVPDQMKSLFSLFSLLLRFFFEVF